MQKPLVAELLRRADEGNYAIGAFNFTDMTDIKAIVEAAEEEKAPVILLANWQPIVDYIGIEYLKNIVETAKKFSSVPIVLQLDHGKDFRQVITCIQYSFDSIMIDGSYLPYEENVALTKKVVEIAHGVGIGVEAELGRIGGVEEGIAAESRPVFTEPKIAKKFVEDTGVDALAIAFGTAHGFYKDEPKLAFDILEKTNRLTDIPLVMHGGTGVPQESLKKSIILGINKVNIGTDLKVAYFNALKEGAIRHAEDMNLIEVLRAAKDKVKEIVKTKMRLLGASGKMKGAFG
ncbi:putative fructose-bisphosphate aldolase [subsurface metagenome]